MAKFGINEADNYGGLQGGGFFSLKNDKDTAVVRFLYNTIEDVIGHAVHELEIDGKKRYVNCIRTYNQPIDDCPLCAAGYKVFAKLFIMVYDEDSQEIKIWDRGKTFFSKMSSLCSRYNPLVSTKFEIERNGERGDTKTTYETFALETDETTLADLPEVPELLGSLILDKTFEELEFFLDYGYFESDDEQIKEVPTRNPASDRRSRNTQDSEAPTRRTTRRPTRRTDDEEPNARPVVRRRPTNGR